MSPPMYLRDLPNQSTLEMRFVIASTLLFLSLSTLAQTSSVNKASHFLEQDQFSQAKREIDAAIEDEQLAQQARTWYIYGRVYSEISLSEDPTVSSLDGQAYRKSITGFNKAKQIDGAGSNYYTLSDINLTNLHGGFLNRGATAYQTNDLVTAKAEFEKASLALPADTIAYLYLGVVCQSLEDWECVRVNFEKMAELGSTNSAIYQSIIYAHKTIREDKATALTWARKAVEAIPSDMELRKQMVNLMIETEGIEEAKSELEALIANEPGNANLYFNLGFLNEELGDEEAALEAYRTAIEVDPDYFDAVYNLGVYYYNKAADTYALLNELPQDQYAERETELTEKAKGYLNNALPLMERASLLRPEEAVLYNTLATIYNRLGQPGKAREAAAKYQELKGY